MYLIAEIGTNHNGDEALAMRLVAEAAKTGVQAVKMNYWKPDLLVSPTSEWYERCKQLTIEFGTLEACAQVCNQYGVDFIIAPWSHELVEESAEIADKFKVASGELTNQLLLEAIYETSVSSILSTGMATDAEVAWAVDILEPDTILHCVSLYPTPVDCINMPRFFALQKEYFDYRIGYSSHTIGTLDKVLAYAMGAKTIEFHFNLLDNHAVDESISLYPQDVSNLIGMIQMCDKMNEEVYGTDVSMISTLRRDPRTGLRE